ncbi:MAG: hypothetical protein FJX75_01890 [Armatimonadetes bacterium]|nr:hypothetical protein [Armatimonadota bacterium]
MMRTRDHVLVCCLGCVAGLVALLIHVEYTSAQRGPAEMQKMMVGKGPPPGAMPVPPEGGEWSKAEEPPPSAPEAKRRASAPNVHVEVHHRTFMPGEKGSVRVSLYNLSKATLTAYRIDLEELVPNAKTVSISDPKNVDGLPYRLKRLDLSKRAASATWAAALKKTYPDSWMSVDSKLPALQPGVYVILAKGGGVTQRTWLAVSSRALVTKRSPDKLMGWLVNAETGQPVVGGTVAIYNEKGRVAVVKTEADGRFRYATPSATELLWAASRTGDPAFVAASVPRKVPAYRAYVYTDRPIYRPGHLVRFRGTVRKLKRGAYALEPTLETVKVQIRAEGGDTVFDKDYPLNEWGTFDGEFQLAPEPPLGEYELVTIVGKEPDECRFYSGFEVEAYRKPEFDVKVEMPQKHYVIGSKIPVTVSADYYFGSPVAGGKVSYEVEFYEQDDWLPEKVMTAAGLGSEASMETETDLSGEGRLDKEGKFTFEVQTTRAPVTREMSVTATVSEFALRPREGEGSTTIVPAQYQLSIMPEAQEYVAGDTAVVLVNTQDYDEKPVSAEVEVVLIESKVDREGRSYEERQSRKIKTDADGRGRATYKMARPGWYQLEAWATDADGNPVYDWDEMYVIEKKPKYEWPALRLEADKSEYKPGDVALVHGETNLLGSWMLVTVEGEYLYDAQVRRLLGNQFTLKIPIKETQQPQVSVSAVVVREGDWTGAHETLRVPATQHRLDVKVAPEKEGYEPGQTAKYTITTRDPGGRGVEADVGLAVVDQALYAIREDDTPSPFDVFWSPGDSRVTTDFSLANLYPGGAYQTYGYGGGMPGGAPAMPAMGVMFKEAARAHVAYLAGDGGEQPAARVRRQFLDTAYWAPSVVTKPDGSAEVSFEMPDNLTTWRATARALTRDASGGEGKQETTVTMPLLVRLTLPRFYVAGDEGTAAAIVHNYTDQERQVKVALTAEGARLVDAPEQTITLAPDASKRLVWRVEALGPDAARFLVSADGGEGARDAMESVLPVAPSGVKNVDAFAGLSEQSVSQTIALPANALPNSAKLEVTVSPSLAGPIFEALDYLATYPYGCAEQTLDSFLPNLIVARTLAKLKVDRPEPKNLDRYVSFGLQKLLRYQHEDGGWHWWEFDDSDPYMTAYVVYGLKIADESGYVGASGAMNRGVAYLNGALAEERYREARAYLLWALAYADVWDEESLATGSQAGVDLYQEREKLDIFSRASLALAMSRMAPRMSDPTNRENWTAAAQVLASELDGLAVETGIGSHWTAGGRYRYSWLDNDVEVTSQVLRALLELKPDSANVVPAVRWLMATRRGKAWSSTKDTASAVLALSNYLEKFPELSPSYTAQVFVGEAKLGEASMTEKSIFADPVLLTAEAQALKAGDNTLRIEKAGTGTLYWSARLHYLLPAEEAIPVAKGVTVQRTYRVPVEDPIAAGEQKPGSIVQVELKLVTSENLRYVLLEEPIPAGCEVIQGDDDEDLWRQPWDRREVWDNRIVFFFDYIPKGDRLVEYVLRTEAPGMYRILPSNVALMYFPEVSGHNRLVRMRVRDLMEAER